MKDGTLFDVIIIGGSYSGLSAAMALGRSLRKVLIIDSGLPCNRQTPHSHNFITHDGETPAEISRQAKTQVLKYPTVTFINDTATNGYMVGTGFKIETQAGNSYLSKKLIFATGITDQIPNIKGFAECWGISVVHCPYCHGYEIKNMKTAMLANGERAMHLAGLVKNLTSDLHILTSGKADLTVEQLDRLKKHKIEIVDKEIIEIAHTNGQINSVIFTDGSQAAFNAMYAALPFKQHSDIAMQLGCEHTEMGYVKTDQFQKTNIVGVFACGDNSSMMRSVANAVYTGNLAGAMANKELVEDSF